MNLVTYSTARKVWDFDLLRGLAIAPGRLAGFSIEEYEKKRESFGQSPSKFESGAMRFLGGKSPWRWSRSKISFHPCPSLGGAVNSEPEIFKIAQNTTSEAKEQQYTAGEVMQRLFGIGPCTYLSIYRYRRSKR